MHHKYEEIKKLFEENKNEEKAIKMSKYMRNLFEFYGIQSPERRALYKNLLKTEKINNTVDWYFLDSCYEDKYREFQYFVCDYLIYMEDILNYDDIPRIKNYIKSKQWWDTIDFLDQVVGNIGLRDSRVNDLMLQWSTDNDIWIRRVAIDHQLGRKENTNIELLEQIIINNLDTNEFFINKAIGWSLREYSKTNSLWVSNFIDKYKDRLSKLSIKEGSKYI